VSLLNVFFRASDDELAAVDTSGGPQRVPVLEAKGVLDVELACLECILHGEPLDDVDAVIDLIEDPLRQEPEGDPEAWISPVSERLATALVAAEDERLRAAASAWAETEEMQANGWSQHDAAELLLALRSFCREAQTDGRRIYRWFAL
jgi:hypothetical protein